MRKEGPGWQRGGRGRGRRRHEGRRRHQAGGGEKWGGGSGRRIGVLFVPRRASRASRSTRGAATIVEAVLNGRGRNTVGETMRMMRVDWLEKGEERATPRQATPRRGGKQQRREKKKRQNTETPPPPPRQVKKSKTAAGINGQKPKTPPGRQASVVSDRPHQNKTTVLTWLGPGTTEAGGGERRAREVWLRRRKRKASTLSYTACIPTLGKLECLSLSDIHPYLRSYVWLCLPAACPACSYVGTRGWRRVSKPQKAFAPPLSY